MAILPLLSSAFISLQFAALQYKHWQADYKVNRTAMVAQQQPIDILAVGDIMLGRYVETLRQSRGDDYPFAQVDNLLAGHDAVFGNLEGPIDDSHAQTPNGSLVFSFTPDVAKLLAKHYFTVLAVANNHSFDQGSNAYDLTRTTLQAADIAPVGNSRSVGEEYVYEQVIRGQKIVWLGYCPFCATFDQSAALAQIQHYASDPDVYVIVHVHWGTEYQTQSNAHQQALGRAMIDAGADLILGEHPHVTQEVETYHDRLIVYSMGNFIFDQYFSEATQQELAVQLELSRYQQNFTFTSLNSHLSQPSVTDTLFHEPISLPWGK